MGVQSVKAYKRETYYIWFTVCYLAHNCVIKCIIWFPFLFRQSMPMFLVLELWKKIVEHRRFVTTGTGRRVSTNCLTMLETTRSICSGTSGNAKPTARLSIPEFDGKWIRSRPRWTRNWKCVGPGKCNIIRLNCLDTAHRCLGSSDVVKKKLWEANERGRLRCFHPSWLSG